MSLWKAVVAVLVVSAAIGMGRAAVDSVPVCSSPQVLGPGATVGVGVSSSPGVAWNGTDYAVVYYQVSNGDLRFQRIYADGTPAAPSVLITTTNVGSRIGLVWTGSSYGLTYMYYTGTYYQVNFARLDANGIVLTAPYRVNQFGSALSANAYYPAIATSGSGFAITWQDYRNGAADVYASLVDANGTCTFHDIALVLGNSEQVNPTISWSRLAQHYTIYVQDYRSGLKFELYGAYLNADGSTAQIGAVVSGPTSSYAPMSADSGSLIGVTWYDYRDGNAEIYFAGMAANGYKVTSDVRVTNDPASSYGPIIVWTGGEFGIFWQDYRTGYSELYFQRVGADGTVVGSSVRLTTGGAVGYYSAAFAQHGYLVSYGFGAGLNLIPLGCNYAYAPGCPEAPDAYSITATTDTTSWLSASDTYTDIAYYQVFRNNAQVGTTSKTSYNDSGLSANTQYQYNFRAVNAAGLFSAPCPNAQIYVRSSASLALSVGKSANDIDLSWTDRDGSNSYRVMRGTSPQAMVQINATSALTAVDANAAAGSVCYFYSIDTPQP